MLHRTRRVTLLLGLSLIALSLTLPIGAAAHPDRRVVPADLIGEHVWAGQLCDGTAISVTYEVTDRGRLVFIEATGGDVRVQSHRHWFRVRYIGTGTRVAVWAHWHRRTLELHDRSRTRDCDPPPAEEPPPDDGGNGQTG
jgi:hypothetical protein